MTEPEAPQPASIFELTPPSPINGLRPDMPDDELLAELSADTLGRSWGEVRLKFTHGAAPIYRRIRVQQVNMLAVQQALAALADEERAAILTASRQIRLADDPEHDDNWLRALAIVCMGLAPPHVLKHQGRVVWRADGEPQDIAAAMLGILDAGFDYWHIDRIARAIFGLTQDTQQELSGNS